MDGNSLNNIFNINNFNVIKDETYLYFFRALNKEDNKDLEEGKITENGKIIQIRTDTQRWKETHKNIKPKYDENDNNSLEQMYDHIKPKFCRCTNCISLSCSSTISTHYGRDFYNDKYVMIKIKKEEIGNKVVNAGLYLLNHIEEAVNRATNLLKNDLLMNMLIQIDKAISLEDIANIVIKEYNLNTSISRKYKGLRLVIEDLYPLKNRFSNYSTLNKEQALAKNKLFAKVTLLEKNRYLKPIIYYTKNNINLLRTVDNAFASLEFIHYGEIKKDEIIEISSEEMDEFARKQKE